jgi:hypothetical protein
MPFSAACKAPEGMPDSSEELVQSFPIAVFRLVHRQSAPLKQLFLKAPPSTTQ